MKILVALNENNNMESTLSEHFGHCPFFGIFDTNSKTTEIVKNEIDHNNPEITPVDQVIKFNPDEVFTLGIGQRAINLFNEKNIKLKTGKFSTLKEMVENIDNLDDLNTGCNH